MKDISYEKYITLHIVTDIKVTKRKKGRQLSDPFLGYLKENSHNLIVINKQRFHSQQSLPYVYGSKYLETE